MLYADQAVARMKWKQFFEEFSYKPNWEFRVHDNWDIDANLQGDLTVTMIMKVPNSRQPLPESTPLDQLMGQRTVIPLIPITKVVVLERYYSEEYAREYIWFHIRDMEDHEIGEWFRHKGELCFDPHKEKV